MIIGFENKKNNFQKNILNNETKNEEKITKIEQRKFEFVSKNLDKKFNVDYENEMIVFEDGVTYSFNEIALMKKHISSLDINFCHLIKDVLGVSYAGNIIIEVTDD